MEVRKMKILSVAMNSSRSVLFYKKLNDPLDDHSPSHHISRIVSITHILHATSLSLPLWTYELWLSKRCLCL